jgi:hypothetical protein
MNTCSIHLGSGALLLDMSSLHCVQSEAFQRRSQTTHGNIDFFMTINYNLLFDTIQKCSFPCKSRKYLFTL